MQTTIEGPDSKIRAVGAWAMSPGSASLSAQCFHVSDAVMLQRQACIAL